jgi:hypothetical protein
LKFEASDSNGETAQLTRCVVMDIPKEEYGKLVTTFNASLKEYKKDQFEIAAREHLGGLYDEITQFLAASEETTGQIEAILESKSDFGLLLRDCVGKANQAKASVERLSQRLSKVKSDGERMTSYKQLDEIVNLYDQQKSENERLQSSLKSIRTQTIMLLLLATAFYFVALFVLGRTPAPIDQED